MSSRIPLGRRGATVGGATLAICAAAAAIVATGSSSGSPSGQGTAGSTASGSATVQRRNLVATDTESGTLSYANPQTVYNRLSGTVTWLPAIGTVVHPGHTLFDVDNSPVTLMNGRLPAFRDLTSTDAAGPDIRELNANLVKLGYNPDGIVVDDTWQAATTAGVEALQKHLGETQNGTLKLGRIVFLPGPQLISSQSATVGATAASYTGPSASANPLFVDYAKTSTTGTGTTSTTPSPSVTGTSTSPSATSGPTPTNGSGNQPSSNQTLQSLTQLLKAETTELQKEINAGKNSTGGSPGAGTSSGSPSGSGSGGTPSGGSGSGGNATAIMQTTSTKLVVTVDLNPSLQSEAKLGEAVAVEMPNQSTVGGHVTEISAVAQASSSNSGGNSGPGGSGNSGTSAVPVTITLDKRARGAGLDQAAVSVNFTKASAKHVLSVPVTALVATSGGRFAVQEAAAPHTLLPVRTGLFAAGYVEISGAGIQPGLKVTDSQG